MSRTAAIASLALTMLLMALAEVSAQEVRLRLWEAIYLDSEGNGVRGPQGVAFDGDSSLVVADTGNKRLLVYDLGQEPATPLREIRIPQVPYPVQVGLDTNGEILVLDGRSHRIARLAASGEFVGFQAASAEAGLGDVLVKDFEVGDNGDVYLLDVAGSRILVISRDGQVRRQVGFPPGAGFLSGLAVNANGMIFAVDSVSRKLFVARGNEEELRPLTESLAEDLAFPTAISADEQGYLFVADQAGGGIVIFGQDGSFHGRQSSIGWREGFLRSPSSLIADGDRLFVADRDNNRIQVFSIAR